MIIRKTRYRNWIGDKGAPLAVWVSILIKGSQIPTIELEFGSHTFNRRHAMISKGFNVVVFASRNCGMLAITSGRR